MEKPYNIIGTGSVIGRSIIFSTDWSLSTKTQNYYICTSRPQSKSIRIDRIPLYDGLNIRSRPLYNINKQGIIINFVHNTFFYQYFCWSREKNDFLIFADEYCLWSRSIHTEPKLAGILRNHFLAVLFETYSCWIMIMIDIFWVFLLLLMLSWSNQSFLIKICLKVNLYCFNSNLNPY